MEDMFCAGVARRLHFTAKPAAAFSATSRAVVVAAAVLTGWLAVLAPLAAQQPRRQPAALPNGFVYLADVEPTIRQDLRYATADNFVGRRIAGYEAAECILTRQAAEALARVQAELQPTHALKVFDCYRPVRAVSDFVAWSRAEDEPGRKTDHFPTIDKRDLFRRGFIATVSAHSRGSAVDVAIVSLVDPPEQAASDTRRPCRPLPPDPENGDWELDFGTSFDCFHEASATAHPALSAVARANRDRLVGLMTAAGFRNYTREWWHFSLAVEPFQRTFDFPVSARVR